MDYPIESIKRVHYNRYVIHSVHWIFIQLYVYLDEKPIYLFKTKSYIYKYN